MDNKTIDNWASTMQKTLPIEGVIEIDILVIGFDSSNTILTTVIIIIIIMIVAVVGHAMIHV